MEGMARPSVRAVVERPADAGLSSDELPFPPGSPFEHFFKRFGMPNNGRGGHEVITGQGSGFFITADGFLTRTEITAGLTFSTMSAKPTGFCGSC
jgi:hypothetical protein